MKIYWDDIAKAFPEMANDAQRELTWLKELTQERSQNAEKPDLDELLTGLNPVERDLRIFVSAEIKQLEREGVYLTKEDSLDHAQQRDPAFGEESCNRIPTEITDMKVAEREESVDHNRDSRDR